MFIYFLTGEHLSHSSANENGLKRIEIDSDFEKY